ncbi:hypothetical protein T10_10782 [Trichinella papuae]|uniref:Uncharacterized protein n=1 Tax=Trichinella papuae TaxID=268474 RepID=A0A0V1MET8_9BILA|nr:hypothetical protein T10_10782 [Trichinella papuae]
MMVLKVENKSFTGIRAVWTRRICSQRCGHEFLDCIINLNDAVLVREASAWARDPGSRLRCR